METQGGAGATEGGGGDGQSGQAASTALIEKILSEEPRWQGTVDASASVQSKKGVWCYFSSSCLGGSCNYISLLRLTYYAKFTSPLFYDNNMSL